MWANTSTYLAIWSITFGGTPAGDTDADGYCDDIDLCYGDDAVGDADADGLCDPNLQLFGTLAANTTFDAEMDQGLPGATAILLLSTQPTPGPVVCHPASTNACTDRKILGDEIVGPDGVVEWSVVVPSGVPSGLTVSIQAIWADPASGLGDSS
jgi:hypothetical protein